MDNLISFLIAAVIIGAFLFYYLRKEKQNAQKVKESAERGKLRSDGPQSQHPKINNNYCIGCATCTLVCPEGDVLGMVGGKAMIINGYKCIGHSICVDACPVGVRCFPIVTYFSDPIVSLLPGELRKWFKKVGLNSLSQGDER